MSFNASFPPDSEWSSAYSEPPFPPQGSLCENASVGIGTPSAAPSNGNCFDPCAPLQGDYDPFVVSSFFPVEAEDPYCEYQTNPPAPGLEYVSNPPGPVEYYGPETSQYAEWSIPGSSNVETRSGDALSREYAPMGPVYREGPFRGIPSMPNPAVTAISIPPAPSALPDSSGLCPSRSPQPEVASPLSARAPQPYQSYSPFMAPQSYQQQQQYALLRSRYQAFLQRQQQALLQCQQQQQQQLFLRQQHQQVLQYQTGQAGRLYAPQETLASPAFMPPACPQRISSPAIYHSRCHQQQQQQHQRPQSPPTKTKRSKITRCVVYEDRSANNQKKILKLRGPGETNPVKQEEAKVEVETGAEPAEGAKAARVTSAKRLRRSPNRGPCARRKRSRFSGCAEPTEEGKEEEEESPASNNNNSKNGSADGNDDLSFLKGVEEDEGDEALAGAIHSSNLAASPNLEKVEKKAGWTRTQPVKVVFEKRKSTLFKMCDSIDLITGAKYEKTPTTTNPFKSHIHFSPLNIPRCSVFLLDKNGVPHEYVSEGFRSFTTMPGFLEKVQQVFSSKQ